MILATVHDGGFLGLWRNEGAYTHRINAKVLVVRGGIEPPTPGCSDRYGASGTLGYSVDSPYTPTVFTLRCLAPNRTVSCCLADQMQTKLRRQRLNTPSRICASKSAVHDAGGIEGSTPH